MKEQFCTYEISLKLKELGFDEECFGYWRNEDFTFPLTIGKITTKFDFDDNINYHNFKCLAPLWQQCIDWFREKHNINILINPAYGCYNISITKYDEVEDDNKILDIDGLDFKDFIVYQEAREQAILKAIELITK